MAMASGVYGNFIVEAFTNALAYSINADDTIVYSFHSDSHTPDFDADDEFADLDNEVTGTGYTTGGETLGSPTFTKASGYATFDGTDVSLSTTTLSNVEGTILHDDTLTGDPLLCAVDFGSAYSTVAGTFAITWDSNGIFRIKFDPSA